jgi:hypothetical protein
MVGNWHDMRLKLYEAFSCIKVCHHEEGMNVCCCGLKQKETRLYGDTIRPARVTESCEQGKAPFAFIRGE